MLEPRVTTAPVSLLTELKLVSGSTFAAFELRVGEKVLLDALDSDEHDDLGSLASECRTAWETWKVDLIAWLEEEATEMRVVDALTRCAVLATIGNVAAGGGLDGRQG